MLTGKALIADLNACTLPNGQAALWWCGQQSWILKLGGQVVYLDPFLTPLPSRLVPPLLTPADITNAALITGTHDHLDHIDRNMWPGIAAASPTATFVVPDLLRKRLAAEIPMPEARLAGVNDGGSVHLAGLTITGVAAAHEFLDRDAATGRYPHLSYVIEGHGCTIFHAGDACLYEGLVTKLSRWHFDVMLLPINGRDAQRYRSGCIGNMTYQEAADLAGTLKPGLVMPAHFDMFASNPGDPEAFADYVRAKYPAQAVAIPRHTERRVVAAVPF